MQINGVNGTYAQSGITGTGQEADAYSRQLQKQISEAQKKLQDLSSDETLSPEEKMKKRQEIQQEINDLNIQLRQHQIELRREKQKESDSGSEVTELTGGSRNSKNKKGGQTSGISESGMSAIISADGAMKQARIQGSVANRMENRANVLKSEIKMDGDNTEAKEKELAETQKRASAASAAQMNTLKEAREALKKAEEPEKTRLQKEASDSEKAKEKDVSNAKDAEDEKDINAQGEGKSSSQLKPEENENTDAETSFSFGYTPVDIRL